MFSLRPEQLQLGFLKVLKGSYMWEQAGMYGCVWREHEPYEVLFTDWISYEELLELKRVEEMVEVYYNSGQFAYTMDFLAAQLGTPIDCFEALGRYYEEHGCLGISHSRPGAMRYCWSLFRKSVRVRSQNVRICLLLIIISGKMRKAVRHGRRNRLSARRR